MSKTLYARVCICDTSQIFENKTKKTLFSLSALLCSNQHDHTQSTHQFNCTFFVYLQSDKMVWMETKIYCYGFDMFGDNRHALH